MRHAVMTVKINDFGLKNMKKNTTSAQMKKIIVDTLKDYKAVDVLALNIKTITDIADYMIIGTANSTVHVKTLIEKTREKLASINIKPIGIEGAEAREWMLIDFGDVIVHIMLENIRNFYALEKLWNISKTKIKKNHKRERKTN